MQAENIWQLRTELYVYSLKWRLTKTILELVPNHFSSLSPLLFLLIKLHDSNPHLKRVLVFLQCGDNCQKDIRAALGSLGVDCRCSHK